ncbi:MAG: DUF1566 domain-containing protein [Desulfatibacillum sp.]|nr:DUF1566 domain-containing protein [Desulfatibacillum sp.]
MAKVMDRSLKIRTIVTVMLLLSMILCAAAGLAPFPVSAMGLRSAACTTGDLDGNSAINMADAIQSLQVMGGITTVPSVSLCGDVDSDGKIGPPETLFILQKVSGLRSENQTGLTVVDTGQSTCYTSVGTAVACPDPGQDYFGQDAQFNGSQPAYQDNGDGTVTDLNTGLKWQKSPDMDNDGDIDAQDKRTYDQAQAQAGTFALAGYDDWRLPTIKELYSLIDFRGLDPSGYEGMDTSGLTPFIDTAYFDFDYGDTSAGERIIDAQMASRTLYVSNTGNDGGRTMFGVNFADGRIKGYGLTLNNTDKTFYIMYVRGTAGYLENSFQDNGDGTVSDKSSGLMWTQDDSGSGLDFPEALAWADAKNAQNYLGYNDWRLPDAKELQSIVDYSRSPDTTSSPALDPVFQATQITNEAGQADYACYWSNTTHANWTPTPGNAGAYVAFGRAMGYMGSSWIDVHGAGAQRSDPKTGDPDDFPTGRGPQGDAIRIYNFVRLVRDAG